MKIILVAATTLAAALSAQAQAQSAAPAAGCYIEVRSLMGPSGLSDLSAAIRALDTALRPQVTEINALRAQIARLEQRDEAPAAGNINSIEAAFSDEPAAQPAVALDSQSAEQVRRLRTDLDARQDKLKADYAAQQRALIGPVQEQINRRAQAYATSNGCTALKMARSADLAGLSTSGARNVTLDFVSWYGKS